jgi:hypothetical protein
MLYEDIDGEALIWAASRLDQDRWTRRVICLVSDGAPVDDSTLLANDDRDLLARHLREAEQEIAGQGIGVGTLLIGGEPVPEPALFERAEDPQMAGVALMRLLQRALMEADYPR